MLFLDDALVRGKEAPEGVIRFEFGGPPEYFERRADTKDTELDKGCIGNTLRKDVPFQNFANVREFPKYKEANPDTRSELVVVLPRPFGGGAFGVINLESTELQAFDQLDELFFTAVASRVSLLEEHRHALESRDVLTTRIIKALDEMGSRHQLIPDLGRIFELLAAAIRTILPADAICVVRYELLPDSLSDVEVDYHDGYGSSDAWIHVFRTAKHSFSLDVVRSEEPLVENVKLSGDRYNIRRYREQTEYAMGTVLRRVGGSITALILEFDQSREELRAGDREALDRIRKILVALMGQHEAAREAASFRRTLGVLRRFSQQAREPDYIQEMLKKASPEIMRSLHSSACGFYTINNDAEGSQRLIELAFYGEPGVTDPNVEWGKWLNRKWQERIRKECLTQGFSDFGEPLEELSSRNGKRWHRVFAKEFNLFGDQPKILFFSVKAVDEKRYRTLRMAKSSVEILDAELSLIHAIAFKEEMRIQREAFAKTLEFALRMGFGHGKAEDDASLLGSVHLLLEQWQPLRTSFSAVFEPQGSVLVMHDASLKHLLERAEDRSELGAPLKLPIEAPGLTSRVYRERKSLMSLRVDDEGNENCRDFWEKVTGAPSALRFFAGAPIPGQDGGAPFGVLTVNGRQPPHYQNMPIEARWEVLPVLELIAAELGRELSLMHTEAR